jgi:hypothetical protein
MMSVDQTLTLGTLLHRREQVRGLHHLPPPERLEEEAGTRRFPVVDNEDEIHGKSC